MIINVLNDSFEKIAETDDYVSLMWCKRYNDFGGLDLEVPATIENLQLFKKGYYITRNDDDAIFRITNIELSTNDADSENTLVIGGADCLSILNQRINTDVSYKNDTQILNVFEGSAENYIRELIDNNFISPVNLNRKVSNLVLGNNNGFLEVVKKAKDFDVVGEEVLLVSKANYFGCKISFINKNLVFNLYKGANRSVDQDINPPIVFSPEYDNLISSKYAVDESDVKNAIIPYLGNDDTSDKHQNGWDILSDEITNNKTGLNRYEIKVDIKDVFDNLENKVISSFDEGFKTIINNNLTNAKTKVSFEGEVDSNSYKYKIDWNLGDVVTVENEFGVKANARIIEIVETWNEEDYTLEPIFEFEEIEEVDWSIPALATETGFMLATERGLAITPEEAVSIPNTSIKVSELDVVEDVGNDCCMPIVSNGETKRITMGLIKDKVRPTFYINENSELVVRYND